MGCNGVTVYVLNPDGTTRPPTRQEARQSLMTMLGMTEEQFDKVEQQYLSGRMGETAGVEWYYDPTIPMKDTP